jgi:hypothetical protein
MSTPFFPGDPHESIQRATPVEFEKPLEARLEYTHREFENVRKEYAQYLTDKKHYHLEYWRRGNVVIYVKGERKDGYKNE